MPSAQIIWRTVLSGRASVFRMLRIMRERTSAEIRAIISYVRTILLTEKHLAALSRRGSGSLSGASDQRYLASAHHLIALAANQYFFLPSCSTRHFSCWYRI